MRVFKRLLVLNFFPAFVPPKSGGELRYFHLYEQLSRFFDVTLLSPTYSHHRDELVEHSSRFREYRVPKESVHDDLHARLAGESIGEECSALVCALSAEHPNAYHRRYLDLYPQADVIIHEFPYMLDYDFFFGHDTKPRVYNSHNFESELVKQLWTGPNASKYIEHVQQLEKRLACRCDLVFAVSTEERKAMVQAFGLDPKRVHVAPNGISPGDFSQELKTVESKKRLRALFVGSQHPPNVEAVEFILSELAPSCPALDFLIAGSCCKDFTTPSLANVRLLGPFDDHAKKALFQQADVAINPIFSGAGTNLKALEFMAAGLPLFSTKVGARGLGIKDDRHFILCSRKDMAGKLEELCSQPQKLQRLADQAQRYVMDHFSWSKIASRMAKVLDTFTAEKNTKPLVVLNDFPVHDGRFGGAVRIRKLYSALSEYHPILLVTLNSTPTIQRTSLGTNITEICFPKTPEHLAEENRQNCCWDMSVNDIVSSYMGPANGLLSLTVQCAATSMSAVILSHPYMTKLVEGVESVPIVYEAHNFEYHLKSNLLEDHPRKRDHLERVKTIESRAVDLSRFFICVSEEDGRALSSFYRTNKDYIVLPNGVDIGQAETVAPVCHRTVIRNLFHGYPVIVFIGSGHRPNIEAVHFIINRLAAEIENAYFCIIGDVCYAISENLPNNVVFFGRLPEHHKNVLLAIADIAVNPVWQGSGSNLKLAEYLSFALPTVTSDFGARGYRIENGREVLIADKESFADRIATLLPDSKLQHKLSVNGHRYVCRHHDWRRLAKHYHDALSNRVFQKDTPKILVVTHRFSKPPLGGAERYLLNLIEGITRHASVQFEIICPNVHQITDRYHFSTSLTRFKAPPLEFVSPHIAIRRLPYDESSPEQQEEHCRRLFKQWYREFIDVSLQYLDIYPNPMVLGGWNFPEKQVDQTTQIWSSGRSLIYVATAQFIRVEGFSPKRKTISFFADKHLVKKKTVFGHWIMETPVAGNNVLEVVVDKTHHEEGDPRELGVLVSKIQVIDESGEKKCLPLECGYREWLKEHRLPAYLKSLIHMALNRAEEVEQLFQAVRGPHSLALTEWLEHNIEGFDLILGHGMPFRPIVDAAEAANRAGKPLVLLPHFHFDDEFYHWRTYYEALSSADMVWAFPKRSLPLFYEPLHVSTRYLPGGGVYPEEFEQDHRRSFLRIHRPTRPYFLVLGRKTGSKNYRWVIEAVDAINESKECCELVVIGPDDDGYPIESPNTTYLAEQPRDVVLGAIQGCIALINMSSSESFGIVILEAWMAKKPVVVNQNCVAFQELVDSGRDGFLVERKELSKILTALLKSPTMAAEMGESGHRKVSETFSWDTIAMRAFESLRSLCSISKEPDIANL